MPDWVVMSNTDISYSKNNFFNNFFDNKYSENTWCIGPSIYSPSKNSFDNPILFERRSVKVINFLIFIFSHQYIAKLYSMLSKMKAKNRKTNPNSQNVYEVHGCYFIIRNEFAEVIKEKGFGPFMFSEEAYIAELARSSSKLIYYENDIEIVHNEHTITSKLNSKKKFNYFAESLLYIKTEFYK